MYRASTDHLSHLTNTFALLPGSKLLPIGFCRLAHVWWIILKQGWVRITDYGYTFGDVLPVGLEIHYSSLRVYLPTHSMVYLWLLVNNICSLISVNADTQIAPSSMCWPLNMANGIRNARFFTVTGSNVEFAFVCLTIMRLVDVTCRARQGKPAYGSSKVLSVFLMYGCAIRSTNTESWLSVDACQGFSFRVKRQGSHNDQSWGAGDGFRESPARPQRITGRRWLIPTGYLWVHIRTFIWFHTL